MVGVASLSSAAASHTQPNLVRLLSSCERLSASLSSGRVEQSTRADRRRFETYLAVLQRLWHELASGGAGNTVSETLLSEYRRKIERLAELLDADRMISGSGSSLAFTQAQCNSLLSRTQANAELSSRLQTTTCMQEALRSQLLRPGGGGGGGGSSSSGGVGGSEAGEGDGLGGGGGEDSGGGGGGVSGGGGGAGGGGACAAGASSGGSLACAAPAAFASRAPFNSSFAARAGLRGAGGAGGAGGRGVEAESLKTTLAEQRELHESLLSDLADSVGQLRDRSLQARQAVRDDNTTLDSTSTRLDGNKSQLDENNSRLRTLTGTMRSSTCLICMMLVVVCMLFVGTFLMMKVVPKRPRG